ncbi:PAS domain-containing protein [Thalassobaculum sp.]|uniref:PAS domain-containing protein n=1 Tax=Thalassobaculum sp. TaxID=2022740 RepID=UPI0032F000AF
MPEIEPEMRNRENADRRRPEIERRVDQVRSSAQIAVTELRYHGLRALAEAWTRAADDEGLSPPSRTSFQPSDTVAALGRITVLERAPAVDGSGQTWRYRLVGTEITMALQAEITGKPLEHLHVTLADMLRRQFDQAAAEGVPLAFTVHAIVDHRPYGYEKVVLPVRSTPDAAVDQIVVASYPIDAA